MKVLISGSMKETDSASREAFETTCREIGRVLAAQKAEIIVGNDKDSNADRYVCEGYCESASFAGLHIITSEVSNVPFQQYSEKSRVFTDIRKGSWAAIRVQQVMECDIVLVIAGGMGTTLVAQTAVALEKPCLALPGLGGASGELFEELEKEYKEVFQLSPVLQSLRGAWNGNSAETVHRGLQILVQHNPFARDQLKSSAIFLGLTVLFLIVWVLMHIIDTGHYLFNILAMMSVSVLLGTILNFGMRRYHNAGIKFSFGAFLNHATISIVLGFGFTLLFLIGGLGINGDLTFLESLDEQGKIRVGVLMSTFGLASGFLLEASVKRLRSLLQGQLGS
ncbi:MAG: hypothetical protein ACPGN3_00535 [Opitutales bacterium]